MRRRFLKWIAGSFVLGTFAAVGRGWMSPRSVEAIETGDLKDTLEKGLYARLPEQFEFINRVVALVENETISLKLVYSTFKWSRQYGKGRRYYYFELAMRKRAGDIFDDM